MTRGIDSYDYPKSWEADVVLTDGGTVHLRPIVPSDADALVAFHGRLSDRTRYLRYFGPYPRIPAKDLARFSTVDHHGRVAFIALLGHEIVAVGRYERVGPDNAAEVAFVVQDEHQGRGIGSILLEHLAAAGRERGVEKFVADVLAENTSMINVFREAGFRQVSSGIEEGVLHLEFAIDPTEASVAVARAREQAAEARSVHNLLHPRSVAVIGASADPAKIGHAVLAHLLAGNFAGPVYPVNAKRRSVRGVRAYPTVRDIPDPVDLAVVAVPAALIDDVLDACLAKGVKALVVVTAGFGETGPAGLDAERQLVAQARAHGMRVVGPNALGVLNTDPQVRLNATLAPRLPRSGRAGFFCQSGALGTAILADAEAHGLGLSTFVSAGNRADVSGNDLLQYWETDPATDLVLLYLESFGNPRKFARLARRLGRTKPIVAVKSGHNPIEQALFEQSGLIRVETLAQLFDAAVLLAHQPLPAGARVAVVGNSTAIGRLAADAAETEGLELAGAPVDVGVDAGPEAFAGAVADALRRTDVDSLIVVFVPPLAVPGTDFMRALHEVVAGHTALRKPIVSCFLAVEGILEDLNVPSYPSPERAALALGRVTRYARWRTAPQGTLVRPPGLDPDGARELIAGRTGRLDDHLVERILARYGIEIVPYAHVSDVDDAVQAAAQLGLPVVLKAAGERFWRRADLSGVRLDLTTEEAVRRAYADLHETSDVDDVYVQRMAPKGIACGIGLRDDPAFGTLVSFGLSGVIGDLLGDRAFRALPLTDADAASLISAPKAAPLLTGYDGSPPADLDALVELVLRVAALAEDLPEVRRLSLEPILASAKGVYVTAARIELGSPPSRPDTGPRRLR